MNVTIKDGLPLYESEVIFVNTMNVAYTVFCKITLNGGIPGMSELDVIISSWQGVICKYFAWL